MKKGISALIITMLILLLFTACNNDPSQGSPDVSTAASISAYKSVLQNNTEFFSTDANKNLKMKQLNLSVSDDSGVTTKVTKFTVIDLDNDSIPEVVLWLNVNGDDYYGFEVLHYQEEVVYGYTLSYRTFMNLKADGTFSFSSGASDSGFGTIKFTTEAYSVDEVTYSQSSHDSNNNMSVSYFVNHESATEDEYQSASQKQDEKTDTTWYDFTDNNIETILP